MNHLGTQTLETERLILRKAKTSDAEKMFENWTGDPEVTKYLTWNRHQGIEDSKAYIHYLQENYSQPDFYQWIIEFKDNGEPIGNIIVGRVLENIRCVHIGYCIGRKWWHQGITSEAFARVIRFLFDQVGVNRIEARHDVANPHSGGVMIKCGLIREGILRQAGLNTSGVCDMAVYSILKRDWEDTDRQSNSSAIQTFTK